MSQGDGEHQGPRSLFWCFLLLLALPLGVIAYAWLTSCPQYSHAVVVQGKSYCFDNGHYNVDIDTQ